MHWSQTESSKWSLDCLPSNLSHPFVKYTLLNYLYFNIPGLWHWGIPGRRGDIAGKVGGYPPPLRAVCRGIKCPAVKWVFSRFTTVGSNVAQRHAESKQYTVYNKYMCTHLVLASTSWGGPYAA